MASSVTYSGITAYPVTGPGGVVTHWTADGASIPDALFRAQGKAMLAAKARGVPWVPTATLARVNGRTVSPVESVEHLHGVFVEGRDVAFEVDEQTREAAKAELLRGGQFGEVVDALANENWPALPRELFARLHGDPEPLGQCPTGADWAKELHKVADESDDWDRLRALSQGDAWAAGIGAAVVGRKLIDAFGDALRDLPREDPQKLEEHIATADEALGLDEGATQRALAPMIQEAAAAANACEAVAEAIAAQPSKAMAAIVAGARAATQEIGETLQALQALGCGNEPGHLSRVTGPRDEIMQALRENPALRRIATLAGRLKVAARAAQRSKVRYVPEQIVDVTLGGEISRLLPSELVAFAAPELETLALKRLIERQSLEYSLEGTERKDRGPLVLCVDESGSMKGAPHEFACAVGLALLEICAMQKRAFAYVHFDSVVQRQWIVEDPTKIKFAQLLEEVSYFSGGGTNFEPPLMRAAALITSSNSRLVDADVILLTDGAATWSSDKNGAVATMGQLGARLWGVEIGGCFSVEQTKALAGKVTLSPGLAGAAGQIEVAFGL